MTDEAQGVEVVAEGDVKEAAIVALKWFHRYGYERRGPKIDGKSVVALLEDALNIEPAGRCETPSGVGAWLDEIGESLRRGESLTENDQRVLLRVAHAARQALGLDAREET